MKKAALCCVSCLIVMCLTSCGEANNTSNDSTQAQVVVDKEKTEVESSISTATDKSDAEFNAELLPQEYHIPLEEIYINAPDYHETELTGYTEQFSVHGKKYVTITGNRKMKADSCKSAYEVCSEKFLKAVASTSAKEIKIVKDELVSIHGIEMYRFEGTLYHSTSGLDRYLIGYSFVVNGIACQITGVVVDDSQPQDLVEEMKSVVDEMAKSVRTVK